MKRGEIRRVRNWDYVGHEATGNRPCLIISPDWFNSNGNVIIAPLTTPGPNHEHWWEIHIGSNCESPAYALIGARQENRRNWYHSPNMSLRKCRMPLSYRAGSENDSSTMGGPGNGAVSALRWRQRTTFLKWIDSIPILPSESGVSAANPGIVGSC